VGKRRRAGKATLSLGWGAQESLWPCGYANTYANTYDNADSHTYFNTYSNSYNYSDTHEHAHPNSYNDADTVRNMEDIFEEKMNCSISGVAQSLPFYILEAGKWIYYSCANNATKIKFASSFLSLPYASAPFLAQLSHLTFLCAERRRI